MCRPLSSIHYRVVGRVLVITYYLIYGGFQVGSLHRNQRQTGRVLCFLLALPFMHTTPNILHNDWDGNPMQLTSIGKTAVLQPLSLHVLARSWYLTWILLFSPQGIVSSTTITSFKYTDHRTTSGLRFVCTTPFKNYSCVPRSTLVFQFMVCQHACIFWGDCFI